MSNEEAEDAISRYRQALLGFETCCSRDFREVSNGVRGVAVKLPWVFGKSQLSAECSSARKKEENKEKQREAKKKRRRKTKKSEEKNNQNGKQ